MTSGPYWPHHEIKTIEQAYENLRFACERLEEILEHEQETIPHKTFKRCDKAITVMKVGFKIIKKAISYKKPKLQVVA